MRELAERRAVRLHPDGVDDRVRSPAVGHLAQRLGDVIVLAGVDRARPVAARHFEPLGHQVDPELLLCPAVQGDPARHLADWPQAEHRDRAADRNCGVVDRLPGGWQNV